MEYRTDDTLILELHGFSSDGRTVGRTKEGITAFVRGGLPGQQVLVRLTAIKKRLLEADLVQVLTHTAQERPSPCSHAKQCGGCPWQDMEYPAQQSWKRSIVVDALRRIGKLDLPDSRIGQVLSVAGKNGFAEWGYRNKMEFAFAQDANGHPLLGLRSRSSHTIAEVTSCILQTPRTMAVLAAIRKLCFQEGLTAAPQTEQPRHSHRYTQKAFSRSVRQNDILRFAVIREPHRGGCLVELITLPSPQEAHTLQNIGRQLLQGPWGVTGFVHSIRQSPAPVAYGEKTVLTLGDSRISETLSLQGRQVTFALDHNSFFQVNSCAAELLYNTAAHLAEKLFNHKTETAGDDPSLCGTGHWGKQCWDIYCGVGGLALTMAPHFDSIFGMEAVAPAVDLARYNAKQCQTATKFLFEAGDAAHLERCFQRLGTPDLLVTDPPRAGMDERTTQTILKYLPPRLVLVSCNPATLARDLAMLSTAYTIHEVQPVDLFPQTPHVETIVSMSRGKEQ